MKKHITVFCLTAILLTEMIVMRSMWSVFLWGMYGLYKLES